MPQIIPFVVTAITTVTSAVVAAGPLAVAAFNAVNVIGAAALANAAFGAVQPEVKSSSTAIEWNADPNAPNRFAFGRVGGAGNIIHNATYGPDKMYVGFVGVMSASGPIKGWVGFRADDQPVSFDGNGKAITTQYANVMWLRRQRGLQPEASALASPSGLKNNVSMPRWGASYRLSGKAAFMYTLSENSKRSAYQGKVPTPINTIEGIYCYDPRFDSTYPGGAGPCRLNDPTTWVYSVNAYIHALNWNIGRWEGLTAGAAGAPYASMKVGGIGARPQGIDFAAYVEAANVFDERAWACSAWPDADQSKAAVLDSFLQAGGGIYAERQGRISCMHRAAPRTSIVTITADDTAGTIEYDTTTSLLERINTIRPEYWSEAHDWQMVATDEVTSSVWREEDGQGIAVTKSKGIGYNYVPGSKQARELAALQIAHTREGIRGTAPLRHYLDLEVGDCFTFEVPEAVLNGQKCIVLNVDPDLENDIINVTFASESDGKYPFAFGQADAPPPAPSLTPRDLTHVDPPLPIDWTVTPNPGAGSGQLPIFDLSGVVSNETATAVLVEYYEVPEGTDPQATPPSDDQSWKSAGGWPPTATSIPITVQPDRWYWLGLTYFRDQNRSTRTLNGPHQAPGLIAGGLAPDAAKKVVEDVLDRVGEISGDTEEARKNAELVLAGSLSGQQGLEAEARKRMEADTGVLNEAKFFTEGSVAGAMNLVYVKAETDGRIASAMQVAKADTDAVRSESLLLFSTKTERENGDATALFQARSYTDAFRSDASLIYATQTAMGAGLAATLSEAKSFTDGRIASSMNLVYTKAQVDGALATTLQQANSRTDALRSESELIYATKVERANGDAQTLQHANSALDDYRSQAGLTFASQASLNGVAATAAMAINAAVAADGKASAVVGWALDVNGHAVGLRFANDGSTGELTILTDNITIRSTNLGDGWTEQRGKTIKGFYGNGVQAWQLG